MFEPLLAREAIYFRYFFAYNLCVVNLNYFMRKSFISIKQSAGWLARILIPITAMAIAGCSDSSSGPELAPDMPAATNILFVVLDDIGIDQLEVFGFGGETPPATPTIAALASAGVSFTDAWSMPACSTTRGVMYEGRFPLRTNVKAALGPNDLSNAMTSPYAMTIPKLLAEQGYESALIGKFHIALPGLNPAGNGIVHDLGWDYYAGWMDKSGDPSPIDTTAGGIADEGTYSCGFVPSANLANGADVGACYMADGSCTEDGGLLIPPGRNCRDAGGILDPNTNCQTSLPERLNFDRLSSHSVSPVVYNYSDGAVTSLLLTDPRSRQYRPRFAVDAAVEWINSRAPNQPWMAAVNFASVHTPLIQPPVNASSPASSASSDLDCGNIQAQRVIQNLMTETLDLEIGRLLVAIGLASYNPEGGLVYTPKLTDTMVIILGDNGSLGFSVKLPFDGSRSKGTAYQTGVSVPLVISGPLVNSPGRQVDTMVNVADLYALFAEIAGITNVQAQVPRTIDAMSMLPYLTNPDQPAIRDWNYTEVGLSLQANGMVNGPCVIGACTQIPNIRSICEDNNGVWWGEGNDASVNGIPAPEEGFQYCSQALEFVVGNGGEGFDVTPLVSIAVRDDAFKLVENTFKDCESGACVDKVQLELYEIDQPINTPWLDLEGSELPLDGLSSTQQKAFTKLTTLLADIRATVIVCPGDGNIDGVVDASDLENWASYASSAGLSSVYDFNLDGLTDALDESIILKNMGLDCSGNGT